MCSLSLSLSLSLAPLSATFSNHPLESLTHARSSLSRVSLRLPPELMFLWCLSLWSFSWSLSTDRLDLFAAISQQIYQIDADTDVADMASVDDLVASDLLVEPTSVSAAASGAAGGDHDAVAADGRDSKSVVAESSAPAVVTARLERRAKAWAHVPLRVCFVPVGTGHDDGSTPAPPIWPFTQLPLKPKTTSYVACADKPV
jgi:hypothetical protein